MIKPLMKQGRLERAVFAGEKRAPETFTEGMFTGYASTWTSTPDAYGDTVTKGAFKATLEAWKSSGGVIPVLYGHDMDNPMNNIGAVVDVVEDDYGLKVTCKLDVEDNPVAAQVWRLMKARRLREMSFAYYVTDGQHNEHGGLDLKAVDLLEVSVVMVGANRTALIDTPKHDVTHVTRETVDTTPNNDGMIETSEVVNLPTDDNAVQHSGDENVAPTGSTSLTVGATTDTIENDDCSAVPDELPNDTARGGVGGSLDETARARLTLLEMYLRGKQRGRQ